MVLSVLAYNIHFGQKLKLIQDWIINYESQFDIVCLQEFPLEKNSRFLKIFEANSYSYAFAPSFLRRGKQYGELTLFKNTKIKMLDNDVIKLGTNILERRSYKNNGENSSLLTLLQYQNKKFILANSHLFCFAFNSHRIGQLTKILDRIKDVAKDHSTPTIILGDFNYTSIIRQKRLMDFMRSHKLLNAYKAHTHRLFFLKQQLDYVFYGNCKISNIAIGKKIKYSDHYPVKVDITFKD